MIADKVLGRLEASEADVAAALASGTLSGERIVALKAAEQQLARMEQVREAAAIDDTKSARQQTVDLAAAGSSIYWAPVVISIVIVVGCNYWLGSSARWKRAGDPLRKIAEQPAR